MQTYSVFSTKQSPASKPKIPNKNYITKSVRSLPKTRGLLTSSLRAGRAYD